MISQNQPPTAHSQHQAIGTRSSSTLTLLVGGIALLCASLAPPQSSWGQEKEKKVDTIPGAPRLLPEDTMFYIRLDNADDLREDAAKSSIGLMLKDPDMRPLATDIYATGSQLFSQISDRVGVTLDELLAIPSGQVAVAVIPGVPPDEDSDHEYVEDNNRDEDPDSAARRKERRLRREQYGFAVVLMVDAGKNVDNLQTIVDRIETQMTTNDGYVRRSKKIGKTEIVQLLPPRRGRPEVEYFQREGTIVFGFGHRTAQDVLEQWDENNEQPTLADNARFGTLMSRCLGSEETRPQITFFVDPHGIIDRVIKRSGSMSAGFIWPVIEDLGAKRVAGIAGSSFRGGEIFEGISHLHIKIEPPRDGVLGVLRPETGETKPPSWVPSDVSGYTTLNWDFEQAYDNVGKVIDNFQGADSLKRFAEQPLEKATGIKLKDDLMKNLTGRFVHVTWMEPPMRLNSQCSINAFELSDSVKAKALIAQFRERQPNALKTETLGGSVVYFAQIPRRGNLPEQFRRPEPCGTVLGKWLLIGDSRKFIERASLTLAGSLPKLSNQAEYELVAGELGGKLDGEKPFMLSFIKGADSIRLLYDLAQSEQSRNALRRGAENNPVAKTILDLMDRNEFPPFSKFEKYFAPTGVFAYDEPDGMHMGMFGLRADSAE